MVDERSSVPLAGVAIVVKDAPQIGMTTNSEGEFRITIPVRYQPLVSVSYIGYQPRESVLVAAADNEIRLKEEAQALEEVQVIAYGQQKKVSVTAPSPRSIPKTCSSHRAAVPAVPLRGP